MKSYKVNWTNPATIDLTEITEYILADRKSSTVIIYQTIKSKCSQLKTNPEKYRIVPELQNINIKDYRDKYRHYIELRK